MSSGIPKRIAAALRRLQLQHSYRNRWLGVFYAAGAWLHLHTRRALQSAGARLVQIPQLGPRLARALAAVRSRFSSSDTDAFPAALSWSLFLHLLVLLIVPLLLTMGSCQQRYTIPAGGVETALQVQVEQQQTEDQLVFNMNSAISYYVPKLDESKVLEDVDEDTRNIYQAGQVGAGAGQGGGYAGGMPNAEVRFIRLKYDGGDWDQQMGKGADYNFLATMNKLTGFKVARDTEAIRISDLKRFPRHGAPPFVYVTGSRGLRASSREIKTLRWYLLEEGGLLFADNGGGNFNNSFRVLVRQTLPGKRLLDIPNDDPIYREPFVFPNGAPPLWHHSGTRALGVKHEGRWIVFYHQGDINDAWQDGGSGASDALRGQAFRLGINVVHYAFRQYLAKHGKG